ncbi:MAG: recombinase family protein [Arenicellales bacterium]
MKRAVIYGRVSTKAQDTENQLRELKKVAKRQGWKITYQVHRSRRQGRQGPRGTS